jgi:hypothetical protein
MGGNMQISANQARGGGSLPLSAARSLQLHGCILLPITPYSRRSLAPMVNGFTCRKTWPLAADS